MRNGADLAVGLDRDEDRPARFLRDWPFVVFLLLNWPFPA